MGSIRVESPVCIQPNTFFDFGLKNYKPVLGIPHLNGESFGDSLQMIHNPNTKSNIPDIWEDIHIEKGKRDSLIWLFGRTEGDY